MSDSKNKFFTRAYHSAREMFSSREKVLETLDTAFTKTLKLEGGEGDLGSLTQKIKLFILMIQSYLKGEYREVPFKSILLIFAGLIYFVNPFDLVGDFIPGIGYIDDISIIYWILRSVEEDVLRYRRDFLSLKGS